MQLDKWCRPGGTPKWKFLPYLNRWMFPINHGFMWEIYMGIMISMEDINIYIYIYGKYGDISEIPSDKLSYNGKDPPYSMEKVNYKWQFSTVTLYEFSRG